MTRINFILLTAFVLLYSCRSSGQINQPYSFNSDNLLHHVKELSSDAYEGRRTGTAGATKAKAYIIKQLELLEVIPLVPNFEQPFTFESRNKSYNGVNILGSIKGTEYPDKYIVLTAHYDHEGIKNGQIYNGADDDASGVSALFAFAESFKNNPPKHSVILAFFDAEELGLQGSKYFVDNSIVSITSIILNINMDMVSRNENQELYVTGIKSHSHLETAYTDRKITEGVTVIAGHDGTDGKQNWMFASDHAPFHLKKIPFLYFGVEDHEDYHQPTDVYENIHPEFYKNAVESIIRMFYQIDAMTF
ncbi:M20/M25/M40 family metallo-hydrolase [Bizionia sp. M204]|uniref:M20/M25/M40 family metallo-hydrolase n=1 Tax=Bizionia sp. M204 TaxID=2675331 RepID=UPI0020544EA7|nr:M20/M25/M40 family metallo-hydrolase [Bizionia sp. M204]UPS92341.1 M20/M25/M40 family metallo-hydrolase [Bizionia sp. M204]